MNAFARSLTVIGDVVEPVRNWNPAAKPDERIVYVDLSAVSQIEKQITGATQIVGATAPSRARQIIREGDVLVSTVRPNLNGVALVTAEFAGATASTGFCVLRPRPEKLLSSYLMHWVQSPSFIKLMVSQATGASYPAVSDKIVKASEMPLPSLDEQRRIAAILNKADALRRKRKHSLELPRKLAQTIFRDHFGSLTENTKNWPTVSVADACELIVDCVNRTAPIVETATPFRMIRTTNVRRGEVDLRNTRFVDEETFHRWNRRATPRTGDVLLTREAPVGEVGILKTTENVFLGQRLMLYRANNAVMTPEFLSHSFQDGFLGAQIDQMSSGSTVKHLPLPACRSFQLRLPPIALQRTFSMAIRSAHALTNMLKLSVDRLDVLFSSLQNRTFSGQI